jgi:hypothetical protein
MMKMRNCKIVYCDTRKIKNQFFRLRFLSVCSQWFICYVNLTCIAMSILILIFTELQSILGHSNEVFITFSVTDSLSQMQSGHLQDKILSRHWPHGRHWGHWGGTSRFVPENMNTQVRIKILLYNSVKLFLLEPKKQQRNIPTW